MTTRASIMSVSGASAVGLSIDHDQRQEVVSWHRIQDISVGTTRGPGGESLFTMAIELAGGRIALCREDSQVWRALNSQLLTQLPTAIPFEAWGPALVAAPGAPLVIYTQGQTGTA